MATGEIIAGLAMTEPGGGTDLQLVALKTDHTQRARGVSLLIVDTATKGFRVGRRLEKVGLHGSDTCEIFFDGCEVPASNVLGGAEGQGFYQMMKDLSYERVLCGVNCAAGVEHAFEVTRAYARERRIFDKALLDLHRQRDFCSRR